MKTLSHLIIFMLLVICGIMMFNVPSPLVATLTNNSVSVTYFYSHINHEGDINVSDCETFTIQDCEFNITGKIIVQDNATLIVKNARFVTTPSLWSDGTSLIVKNHAGLLVVNSTIVFHHPRGCNCQIILQNEAKVNITESMLIGHGDIVARDNSTIKIYNSNITIGFSSYDFSGVVTFDNSVAEVEDSTIDGVFIWDKSAASIKDSVAKLIRTGWKETDETVINITNSRIDSISVQGGTPLFHIIRSSISDGYFHCNTSAWFIDSSTRTLRATGNAMIWLIGSSAGSISTNNNAKVFVGWNLPLFGPVTVSHTWIPTMQILFMISISVVIGVSYIVYSRKKKQWDENKVLVVNTYTD